MGGVALKNINIYKKFLTLNIYRNKKQVIRTPNLPCVKPNSLFLSHLRYNKYLLCYNTNAKKELNQGFSIFLFIYFFIKKVCLLSIDNAFPLIQRRILRNVEGCTLPNITVINKKLTIIRNEKLFFFIFFYSQSFFYLRKIKRSLIKKNIALVQSLNIGKRKRKIKELFILNLFDEERFFLKYLVYQLERIEQDLQPETGQIYDCEKPMKNSTYMS